MYLFLSCPQSFDGVEHLMIPVDASTLTEFVEQHTDS